jgi:uncharacterized protein (UPF0276 family)
VFEHLPRLGAGLGYQPDLHDDIVACRDEIDFLEIPTDAFLGSLPEWAPRLRELKQSFTTVAHGIYMSLGDASGPHLDYLERLAPYIEELEPVWFSDHLDLGNIPDERLGMHFHGVEVPFTLAQAKTFQQNMRTMQERIGLPLLVENIAHDFLIPMPGALSEPAFLRECLTGDDQGLLLDVENLRLNGLNYGYDPYDWLAEAPLERVVQIHVAGGAKATKGSWAGRWVDSHSQPVADATWALVEHVVTRGPVKAILLERDQNYPPMAELLAELEIARALLGTVSGASRARSCESAVTSL